jgi:hypothetical protein
MGSGGSTVTERTPRHFKAEGLSPAVAAGSGRETVKNCVVLKLAFSFENEILPFSLPLPTATAGLKPSTLK